jgi:hypothetical protein
MPFINGNNYSFKIIGDDLEISKQNKGDEKPLSIRVKIDDILSKTPEKTSKANTITVSSADGSKTYEVFKGAVENLFSPARKGSDASTVRAESPSSVSSGGSSSASVASAKEVSKAKKADYSEGQIYRITSANVQLAWIKELMKPITNIKVLSPGQLSLEPEYGVSHEKIVASTYTGAYNTLLGSVPLVKSLNPRFDESKLGPIKMDFSYYVEVCDHALSQIDKMKEGDDKMIDKALVSSARFLASRYDQVNKGTKKDTHMFTLDKHLAKSLTPFTEKFSHFGTKL